MRNLVLSRAIAEATHKYPAFAIAYMGPDLPISDYIESERWAAFKRPLLQETSPPRPIEIREFVRSAAAIEPSLTGLRGWVDMKFDQVTSARKSTEFDK